MRILLLVDQFPPFSTSAARLFAELAEDLNTAGHQVAVVTGRAPPGANAPVPAGIRVTRVRGLPVKRGVPLLRALDQAWAGIAYFFAALFSGKHDIILVYSPPLPLAATAIVAGWLKRAPCVVNVQDLYPKTAVDLGLLRARSAIRLAEWLEGWVYRRASAVTVHSEGNRAYVVARGGDLRTTTTIHNWVDLSREVDRGEAAKELARLVPPGRFVAFYGGAMGFAQALDEILEAATILRDDPRIQFLLVGDGVMREPMERLAAERGLSNVKFVKTVPPAAYERLLAASDVAFVTLRHRLASPVVPGKIQSIMAAGKPVITSTNPVSDAKRFTEEAGCGVFVEAGHPVELAAALQRLSKEAPEALAAMGRAGREYAAAHFDRRDCVKAYETLFTGLRGASP